MFELLGKKINLGFALGLSEVEFKDHYKSIFKSDINEAWDYIEKQKNAGINKSVEENAKPESFGRSKQKRDKGVHTETEPTGSDLD